MTFEKSDSQYAYSDPSCWQKCLVAMNKESCVKSGRQATDIAGNDPAAEPRSPGSPTAVDPDGSLCASDGMPASMVIPPTLGIRTEQMNGVLLDIATPYWRLSKTER